VTEQTPQSETPDQSRRRGREAALQMLYQWEIGRMDPTSVCDTFWSIDGPGERPAGDRAREFAERLFRGTVGDIQRIDELIADSTENWRPARMGAVDRLIIRLGVHEILAGDTPPAVVINEALDMARTFSTDEAVRFVNGVLDGINRRLEGAARPSAHPTVAVESERP
jgi:N utilization substance protein B